MLLPVFAGGDAAFATKDADEVAVVVEAAVVLVEEVSLGWVFSGCFENVSASEFEAAVVAFAEATGSLLRLRDVRQC